MTQLSVNINKIATLRNSRGEDMPNVKQAAIDCQLFGANGITVHPRPDERHIKYEDVRQIKPIITTEFNIEGNPIPKFMDLVKEVKPNQVTLVPDADNALTSNAGWDTIKHRDFLTNICAELRSLGIRSSIFIDPIPKMVEGAKLCGADRVELYTAAYAKNYNKDSKLSIAPYLETALVAQNYMIGVNAGHDLNLQNIGYFIKTIPWTKEVSIGHALISEALYMGLEKTIASYLLKIKNF